MKRMFLALCAIVTMLASANAFANYPPSHSNTSVYDASAYLATGSNTLLTAQCNSTTQVVLSVGCWSDAVNYNLVPQQFVPQPNGGSTYDEAKCEWLNASGASHYVYTRIMCYDPTSP